MITATTKSPSGGIDLYPVYDKITVSTRSTTIPGYGTYHAIYDGQFYVNLGLWRRQTNNIALRKDLYKAATKINEKSEVYSYNKRTSSDDYWNISVRMQDYESYYGSYYDRDVAQSDYMAAGTENGKGIGKDLEVYVTYQIIVRNLSESIVNEITEIVDYYDNELEYKENLSWVMTGSKTGISQEEYLQIIRNSNVSNINRSRKY